MPAHPVKIDVWSDLACPWCYIGKRNLESGIARLGADGDPVPVEVEYHSFQLAPDTPVDFEGSEADYLMGYKGLPEVQVKAMIDRVVGIARSVGLEYDYDALQHTNTLLAHQLLHYARAHGKQSEAKERLLSAYFVEGRHIGRVEDLADLAAEIGLDRQDVVGSLQSEAHLPAVLADIRRAAELGIHGVPFFVLDGRYALSGAQPAEVFAEAITRVAEGAAAQAG